MKTRPADDTQTVFDAIDVYGQQKLASPVEILHEATKFYPSASRRDFIQIARFLKDKRRMLRASHNCHEPLPQGRAPDGPRFVPLPNLALRDALQSRRSERSFAGRKVSHQNLMSILGTALAVNRQKSATWAPKIVFSFRPYPSGGALYPIEFYVIVLKPEGFEPGLYHFHPKSCQLQLIHTETDLSTWLKPLNCSEQMLSGAAFVQICSCVFERSTEKYGARGYRFSLLEAGHAAQNTMLAALSLEYVSCAWGGYFDDLLNERLLLDGAVESVVAVTIFG